MTSSLSRSSFRRSRLRCLVAIPVAMSAAVVAVAATPTWADSPDTPNLLVYQGQLLEKGRPANGLYDVEWGLFDDADPRFGRRLSESAYDAERSIADGDLRLEIPNPGDFEERELWLEVRVRRTGSGEMTPLLPRQALSGLQPGPAEFAIRGSSGKSQGGSCNVSGDLTVDGNLGIGVSNPGSRLQIGGSLGTVRFDNQGDQIELTAPSDVRVNASSAATLRLRVAGGDRLTIENSGEVGIGTTNPQGRLDVHGAIKIDSAVGLFRVDGSGACTVLCQNAAAGAGFQGGSGACVNGWSGGTHVGCATSATRCLCSALN